MVTFIFLAIVMIIGAIGVITFRQPVHAALSLVGTIIILAVIYVTLQAHFLAAVQVIVYAGAIMVLFLFVIMLLNVEGEGHGERFGWLRLAAYGTATVAIVALVVAAFMNPRPLPEAEVVDAALSGGGAAQIGEVLFERFVLAFQLVAVLLLTSIVGAVSLVQRKVEQADIAASHSQETGRD
ncbi:MAG: NADH-quinone oxidoreductase subunit J [Truepera sp.]|nr:NADH-quinone oxidoreductase subunit J [Truepera sp.]